MHKSERRRSSAVAMIGFHFKIYALFILVLFVTCTIVQTVGANFNVPFGTTKKHNGVDGSIYVDDEKWLQFDQNTALFANSQWYSQSEKNGVSLVNTRKYAGDDIYGKFNSVELTWSINNQNNADFSTEVRSYVNEEIAVFTATILSTGGLKNTSSSIKKLPILNFPSIYLSSKTKKYDTGIVDKLGYAYFHGLWQGPVVKQNLQILPRLPERHEGPVIFTNSKGKTVLIGPLNDPLNLVFQITNSNGGNRGNEKVLSFGPSQMLQSLPEKYTYSVVAVFGEGATKTIQRYGKLLLGFPASTLKNVANEMRSSRVPDPFLEKVTAWTDNGAYFFYDKLGQTRLPSAQSALPKWINLLNAAGISVNSLQLDGWWMNQTTSAQNSNLIPDWKQFRNSLGKDVNLLLYKTYFSKNYDLFEKYNKTQSPKGVWYPVGEDAYKFYTDLFNAFVALGAKAFETDFMSDHLLPTPGFASYVEGLPLYHDGLAKAALDQNLPVQFCMPSICQVLATAKYRAVTNVRVSTDYATEKVPDKTGADGWVENYVIGIPSLITWAIGVAPSKDIVVTTEMKKPTGGMQVIYQNSEMDFALAVLSTGPVGLGDAPNFTNISLVQKGIRIDGTLLKPDKPLTAVDSTFVPTSTRPHGLIGFLPTTKDGDCNFSKTSCSPSLDQTHTSIPLFENYAMSLYETTMGDEEDKKINGNIAVWHIMLSMHLASFAPPLNDFFPEVPLFSKALNNLGSFKEWRWSKCSKGQKINSDCLHMLQENIVPDVSSGPSRSVGVNGSDAYRLFHFSPNLPVPSSAGPANKSNVDTKSWIMLGEIGKIVPMSNVRFKAIGVTSETSLSADNFLNRGTTVSSCLEWTMVGGKNENVCVGAVSPSGIYMEDCFVVTDDNLHENEEKFKFCE
eukprot:g4131.t1